MYRAILCAAAALLLVTTLQPATADDLNVCIDLRRVDEAIEACSRLLALNPNYAPAYYLRGVHYFNKGDSDRAISDFDQLIRLLEQHAHCDLKSGPACDPWADANHIAAAYGGRGAAYSQKGDDERAISDLDQAIRLDPKSAKAYIDRAYSYNLKRDYDRAIADFDQGIRLDPNVAVAYNNRGNSYAGKGDYERAISDYDEAIRLDPKYTQAYNNRGNTYSEKRDYDRAIADYSEAIRLDPNFAVAYNNRGETYRRKNETEHAIADFEQALKLDPSLAEARQVHEPMQRGSKQPLPSESESTMLEPEFTLWERSLVAHLARFRRYPPDAGAAEGVTTVHFQIDRQGHVLKSGIAQSSGSSVLDEEA
jgi:tetratricopeptide (TPR) repeat protein